MNTIKKVVIAALVVTVSSHALAVPGGARFARFANRVGTAFARTRTNFNARRAVGVATVATLGAAALAQSKLAQSKPVHAETRAKEEATTPEDSSRPTQSEQNEKLLEAAIGSS